MTSTTKIKVLVVDDSGTMRNSALALLKDDYEVMTSEDGLDAIAVLGSFRPDIIFIDIVMPKLDGYETVALIRMNEAFGDVPILQMSSKGSVFDIARGKLLGITDAIIKPFNTGALTAAIEKYAPSAAAEAA
jgi:twitching motility two-component system response regulator PilG